jgi:hypothetical protein
MKGEKHNEIYPDELTFICAGKAYYALTSDNKNNQGDD